MATSSTMREDYEDCLSQQMSEYELLKSMYSDPGELILCDKNIIYEMNNYLNNKTDCLSGHLDFKLNLLIEGLKLEVFVNLPSLYPKTEPDIYVRCNNMNRQNESSLNLDLMNYIKENSFGEVCLYTAISWLQENVHKYNIIIAQSTSDSNGTEVSQSEDEFARLWIYSHHIYNKRKRDEIVKKAKELKLTGFSLPGKPGIICVEGYLSDCMEWWKDIKSMCWKKIVIRKTETFDVSEKDTHKKFSSFEELMFRNPENNKSSTMSELSKLLNELGLNQIFNELFGLCNDD